tara:strand:+ start:1308 stop:1649 length:342 start_codon:yes stop_codon:yes gene_type:complete
MIKKFKIIFYLSLFSIFLNSCGSVKDGLTLKKKDNSEQFLIEKKKPLIMPPEFDELPQPGNSELENQEISQEETNDLDLKTLIKNSKKSSKNTSSDDLSSEIKKKINKELNKQ